MKRHWHSCATILLLGAAACSPDARQDAMIDACSLLAEGEIAGAVNSMVAEGERNDTGLITEGPFAGVYSSSCVWRVLDQGSVDPGTPLNESDYVIVLAMQWPDGKDPEGFLDNFRSAASHGVIDHAPVPLKIGDSSLWWGDGVAVTKNQASFGVSVRLKDNQANRRVIAEGLAGKIVPRL